MSFFSEDTDDVPIFAEEWEYDPAMDGKDIIERSQKTESYSGCNRIPYDETEEKIKIMEVLRNYSIYQLDGLLFDLSDNEHLHSYSNIIAQIKYAFAVNQISVEQYKDQIIYIISNILKKKQNDYLFKYSNDVEPSRQKKNVMR